MINRYQTLWLVGGPKVSIPVSQYDTMWRFVFSIINGSVEWEIPSGATAILNGRKPDGNVIAISGTIANNKVTVDATEQMTVVAGEVVCELSIMSGGAVVGTANFVLAVEDAPKKDGEPISESDLSAYAEMIAAAGELVEEAQEIIEQGPFLPPGGTPGQVLTKTVTGETWGDVSGLPDGGSNGQVLTKTSDGAAWSDAGTPTQAQTNTALADYLDEHPEAVTNIPDRIKQALLACFQKVAWIDANGQTYYQNLYNALMNKEVLSIVAVFTQGSAVIYDTDSLDDLKQYLVVTASYDDGTTGEVTAYELSGTLTAGTSTITVSYGGKTTTFDVTVTQHEELMLNDILTLDGIKNTRNGHDATATTWEDLSGNDNDFAKYGSASSALWGDDCLTCDGTNRALALNKGLASGKSAITMELVVAVTGNGSTQTGGTYYGILFGDFGSETGGTGMRANTYNANGVSSQFYGSNMGFTGDVGSGNIKHIVWVFSGTEGKRYVNGELAGTVAITFPSTMNTNYQIGASIKTNAWYPRAKIFRIGLSGHAMTAAEVAERYAFFADRFGIV